MEKQKRIKRVFSNSNEVIHRWANQTQDSARCGNVFFENERLYSYGYHYLLGMIHKVNGKNVAVVNSTRYSATTSKHQSWARGAVAHLPMITSSDPTSIMVGIQENQGKLVDELMGWFSRRSTWYSSKKEIKNSYVLRKINEFNAFCDAVNKKDYKINVTDDFIDLMNEHNIPLIKKREARWEKHRLEREQREKQRQLEAEANKVKWLQGENVSVYSLEPQLIRVKDDTVQTSRGASVTVAEAREFLQKLLAGQVKQGDKVGGYEFLALDGNKVQIGCHKIDLNQAKEVLNKIS